MTRDRDKDDLFLVNSMVDGASLLMHFIRLVPIRLLVRYVNICVTEQPSFLAGLRKLDVDIPSNAAWILFSIWSLNVCQLFSFDANTLCSWKVGCGESRKWGWVEITPYPGLVCLCR